MKVWIRVAGMLAAICWMVFGITLIIFLTAGNGGYLADRMLGNASPEVTGLPEAEYPGVGEMTAGYLTGRTKRFHYTYTDASGRTVSCFHDDEEAHMADCRALIRLDRTAMILSGGLLILLTAGFLRKQNAEGFCRGLLWGLRIVVAAAAGLLAWALADFDGFFVTFHRIAFTNDGWLLNPSEDLLIRLMPETFFTDLGVRGLKWAAALPAAPAAAARIALRKAGRRNGK